MIEVDFTAPRGMGDAEIRRLEAAISMALADMARAEWIRVAQASLNTTQQDYIAGIGGPEAHGATVSLQLHGKLPNMIESGWGGGDMRSTLLQSASARTSKEGYRYLAVPFRHSTPGSRGSAGRQMPGGVYAAARKLRGTLTGPDGKATLWGERLRAGLASKLRPHHSTDIYAGMIRAQKTYEAATQSSYTTFRMISNNPGTRKYTGSKEVGWIHPGITPRNFASQVTAFVRSNAQKVVDAMMGG